MRRRLIICRKDLLHVITQNRAAQGYSTPRRGTQGRSSGRRGTQGRSSGHRGTQGRSSGHRGTQGHSTKKMNLNDMNRRVDRLLATVGQQCPREKPSVFLKFHLLTETERGQLETFFAHLQAAYHIEPLDSAILPLVSDDELDELENWYGLLEALDQENIGAASEHRRKLRS